MQDPRTTQGTLDAAIRHYVAGLEKCQARARDVRGDPEGEGALQIRIDAEFLGMIRACRDFDDLAAVGELGVAMRSHFREMIAPYFSKSVLMTRALHKPRGTPGDYQTLTGLYAQAAVSRSSPLPGLEDGPFSEGVGEYLDRTFLGETLAVGINNRKDYMRGELRRVLTATPDVRMLDIASGPFQEGYELSQRHPELFAEAEIHLLDADADALRFSIARLDADVARSVAGVEANIIRLCVAPQRARDELGTFGYICNFGLMDYLPDRTCRKVLELQKALLAPGGEMVVAFKDRDRYFPTSYDWVGDWHFVGRDVAAMEQILAAAGIEVVATARDATDAIVFFHCR